MGLVINSHHDKYCLGRKDIKLCGMCKNKKTSNELDKLSISDQIEIKGNMVMVSPMTCKVTNASYYVSSK